MNEKNATANIRAFFVDLGSIFDLGGLRPLNSLHILPPADTQAPLVRAGGVPQPPTGPARLPPHAPVAAGSSGTGVD